MFPHRSGLDHVKDVSVSDWLVGALRPVPGYVALSAIVPPVFPAYARILHPVDQTFPSDQVPDEWPPEPLQWAEVASQTGRLIHRLVQFDSLVGVSRYVGSAGWEAEIGSLRDGLFRALCEVLERHTSQDASCYFALWDGWGWLDGVGILGPGPERETPPAFPPEVLNGPRVAGYGRDYLLFHGPLDSWTAFFEDLPWWAGPQSPNMVWPEDRAWCVATEIDFDSTYIGGRQVLVDELLSDSRFESWPAEPDDQVDAAGDTINGLPPEY